MLAATAFPVEQIQQSDHDLKPCWTHPHPLISPGTLHPPSTAVSDCNSLSDLLIARYIRHQVSPNQSNRVAHIEMTGVPDKAAGRCSGQSPGDWASSPPTRSRYGVQGREQSLPTWASLNTMLNRRLK